METFPTPLILETVGFGPAAYARKDQKTNYQIQTDWFIWLFTWFTDDPAVLPVCQAGLHLLPETEWPGEMARVC